MTNISWVIVAKVLAVPLIRVGFDDVMISLLKMLNSEWKKNDNNLGNIENFDTLFSAKHNGLGCSVI